MPCALVDDDIEDPVLVVVVYVLLWDGAPVGEILVEFLAEVEIEVVGALHLIDPVPYPPYPDDGVGTRRGVVFVLDHTLDEECDGLIDELEEEVRDELEEDDDDGDDEAGICLEVVETLALDELEREMVLIVVPVP